MGEQQRGGSSSGLLHLGGPAGACCWGGCLQDPRLQHSTAVHSLPPARGPAVEGLALQRCSAASGATASCCRCQRVPSDLCAAQVPDHYSHLTCMVMLPQHLL
jgi:hypothetical protein